MSFLHVLHTARTSLIVTLTVSMLAVFSFIVLEPSVLQAVSDDFTVTQTITDEISLVVQDITMVGSIQGITGGYATGTGSMVVTTNDTDGYTMTLGFSSTTAMIALGYGTTNSGYVNNYSLTATTVPDFQWQEDGTSAEFGYTVNASNTPDLAQFFHDNGTSCNAGSGDLNNRCWMSPTTTAVATTIINRTSAADDGATTTLKFRVVVPNSPSPALPADTYVATGTLTATNNP